MRTIVKKWKNWDHLNFVDKGVKIGRIDIEHLKDETKLWSFYIDIDHRRKGYGFKAIKKVVRKYNKLKLWLWVDSTNHYAIRIYKECGFKITEDSLLRPRHYMVREPEIKLKHLNNYRQGERNLK